MSPADTRNIRVLHHVNPLRAKMLYKTNVVCATHGRVRLPCRAKVNLYTEMNLHASTANQHPPRFDSLCGFGISFMPRIPEKNVRAACSSPGGIASCT